MELETKKGSILSFAMLLISGGVFALLAQLDNEQIHWEIVLLALICIAVGLYLPKWREDRKKLWHMKVNLIEEFEVHEDPETDPEDQGDLKGE